MERTKLTSVSPETQNILDLCTAIVDGEDKHEELAQAVSTRLEELHQAVDDFFGQVDQQGEEYYEKFKREFEEIEYRFRRYEEALEQIQACLEQGSTSDDLWKAAEALAEASHFLRVAIGRYEQADLSQGSSKYPIVNLLDNLGQATREGKAPQELWESTCIRYIQYYQNMLEEIQKSPDREAPGVPEREKAVTTIIELFKELQTLTPTDSADRYAELISRMSGAHMDLEKSFLTYNEATLTQGPTKSPYVNLILNTAAGYKEGRFSGEAFKLTVQEYLETVHENLEELQAILETPPESAILNEETAKMVEAMEGVADALEVLLEYADNPNLDPERVKDALELLKESGDRGAEATKAVEEYNESAGKITCMHCETKNPPGSKVCSGCQRPLPMASDIGTQSSFQVMEGGKTEPDFTKQTVMTDMMKELFEKCEEFMEGGVDPQTLLTLLDTREKQLDEAEEKLSELQPPEIPEEADEEEKVVAKKFVDLADDTLELLYTGIEECRQGLEKIRQAVAARDQELMQEGIRYYFQGNQRMWQVWRLDNAFDAYMRGEEIPL